MIVVHVSHEAVEQIGGIGTVIAGLVTSDAYAETVSRTILLGPLFSADHPANRRLGAGGKVTYSSMDSLEPPEWHGKFHAIEHQHGVNIIYGHRPVTDACTGRTVDAEVVLADVFGANLERVNHFKGELYKHYGIESDQFEGIWDYEQYVRLAEPGFEAVQELIGADNDEPILVLAHEYMGVPTALKAMLSGNPHVRTVFYAHEVASVRPVVERREGHDTMFYNIMAQAAVHGMSLAEVFPKDVARNYKHPLVRAARYCDHVFAVGELIREELKFVDSHFRESHVDLVFNGIPAEPIAVGQRVESQNRMRSYAESLVGFYPDWVFSHVARAVLSKGIWRDVRILHELDGMLAARGERAVYFMLGTLGGQRRAKDITQMETDYGWPMSHEEGWPDLVNGEDVLAGMFENFNAEHDAIKLVLVNQWGWSREACGHRMPADMSFADIRRGIDVEFGLSVYEPYGISQLEPLSYGATCVVSNVCGCLGYARRASGEAGLGQNVLVGDFLTLLDEPSIAELKAMTIEYRDGLETIESARLAGEIATCLTTDAEVVGARLKRGWEIAEKMSWDHVVTEYFLPALAHATDD
jgi:hypothetical protein